MSFQIYIKMVFSFNFTTVDKTETSPEGERDATDFNAIVWKKV